MTQVGYGVGPDCLPHPVRDAGLFYLFIVTAFICPQYLYSLEFIEVQVLGQHVGNFTSFGGDRKIPTGCGRDRTKDHWPERAAR